MKKNVLFALMISSLFMSCTSESDDDSTDTGFSSTPVSGKLYNKNFIMKGGKANYLSFNGVESADMVISAQALGCETASTSDNFPITIVVPRAVGTYTSNVFVTFHDPESDDYVSVSGSTVEVTSVTSTLIKGKIRTSSTTTDNNINGTFEIPFCN